MRKEIIISALISISITGGLGLYIAELYSQPNPTLEITKLWIDEQARHIDFYLSNDQTGIAIVNKIELDVKNFETIQGCSDIGIVYARPMKFITDYIDIKPNPRIYTIDNLFDFDRVEWFPTSDGLKYGGSDIDQFTIQYIIPKNIVNDTHGYSFDFLIRAEWCDSSLCFDKKIAESPIHKAERLGTCSYGKLR